MGYRPTVPSSWKEIQLFGKMASGVSVSKLSSTTTTFMPLLPKTSTKVSNSPCAMVLIVALRNCKSSWKKLFTAVSSFIRKPEGRTIKIVFVICMGTDLIFKKLSAYQGHCTTPQQAFLLGNFGIGNFLYRKTLFSKPMVKPG